MKINEFVFENRLKPADAIVLRKKFMGMVDHFAIYMGKDSNGPKFVANFTKGIQIIPEEEINTQLEKYVPERIDRFEGNISERKFAIKRAEERINENSYGLFSNNCEHFKNWVHFGKQISEQVDNAGTVLSITGTTLAVGGLLGSNKKARNWGIGLLATGLLLKSFSERKEPIQISEKTQ